MAHLLGDGFDEVPGAFERLFDFLEPEGVHVLEWRRQNMDFFAKTTETYSRRS